MGEGPSDEHFGRVIGRRTRPEGMGPPSRAARDAMTRMAQYRTRVPKGIFRYASHEDANRDWERWRADAMVERLRPSVKR